MLAKLLAILSQLKAAGATAVIIAGAATVTVASTSPEVQDSLHQLTNNVGLSQSSDCDHGQPVVVAQRNSADKLLRAAYQTDQKKLNDLRGGKDVDNKAVGEVVRKYDDLMRDRLNTALNAVAALTLGREGQNKTSASPSTSASPVTTPTGSPSAEPSCSPKPSASASPAVAATPSPSPKPSDSGKPDQEGRVTVAERTTLNADIQKLVDDAIKDMDAFVKQATDEAAKLPAPDHGKPSDNPGNKPSDKGKPAGTAHP